MSTDDIQDGEDSTSESTTSQTVDPPSAAGQWYASCDVGPHPPWLGPNRDTRDAAQADADKHNLTCPDSGAVVVNPN